MKIGYLREDIEKELRKSIYDSELNSEFQDRIIKQLIKIGYSRGYVTGILEGNTILNSLDQIELGVIMKVIYDEAGIGYVNPKIHFEVNELRKIGEYVVKKDNQILKHPIVLKGVDMVNEGVYKTIISTNFLVELFRSNLINYNFDTQREAREIKHSDSIMLSPTINRASINAMTDELVKGLFMPNTLTFNILNSRAKFKYDEKERKLYLLEGSFDIPDGYHRLLAIISASRIEDLNVNFELRIMNFDVDRVNQFIIQEDKRNPIDVEHLKKINQGDLITAIVNRLNTNSQSELKGKITTNLEMVRSGDALVSFDIMYNAIKKLWNPATIIGSEDTADYLRDFFNRLVSMYPNEFKEHIKESRARNPINDERMFLMYIILAKKLEGNNNWKVEVKEIMNNIFENSDIFNEYLEINPSLIKRRFNKYLNMGVNIMEVFIK